MYRVVKKIGRREHNRIWEVSWTESKPIRGIHATGKCNMKLIYFTDYAK